MDGCRSPCGPSRNRRGPTRSPSLIGSEGKDQAAIAFGFDNAPIGGDAIYTTAPWGTTGATMWFVKGSLGVNVLDMNSGSPTNGSSKMAPITPTGAIPDLVFFPVTAPTVAGTTGGSVETGKRLRDRGRLL